MVNLLRYFAFGVTLVSILFSCKEKKSVATKLPEGEVRPDIRIVDSSSWHTTNALTIPEYQSWIKKQRGITYDKIVNTTFDAVMWYQPIILDAAMSARANGDNTTNAFNEYLKTKKGYHYINLEVLYKNPSVNNKINKEDFLKSLKEHLFFVKNGSDTIQQPIIEVFPSTMMGQPHHLLILIRTEENFKKLTAGVSGQLLGFKRDLQIDLSETQYKSLPEIKL